MELYEEAVDLALKIDHLVLAKRSANLQAAPSARKKLWLRIARRVIQRDAEPRAGATTGRPLDEQTASRLRESVLAAATLLSECSLLRIEARACERAGRRGVPGAARAMSTDPFCSGASPALQATSASGLTQSVRTYSDVRSMVSGWSTLMRSRALNGFS